MIVTFMGTVAGSVGVERQSWLFGSVGQALGFAAMVNDRAGTEIPTYLLDLQFGGIPIDVMASRMQTD